MVPRAHLKPLPEQVYTSVVAALRETLGNRWGRHHGGLARVGRRVREAVQEMDGIYVAAELDHEDRRGVRIQLWVDRDDLDLDLADDIVHETLRGIGDREILAVCRSFEDEGIQYRFASGTVEGGLVGLISLVGPYARDAAHLARIGSGQPVGFSA